MNATTSEGFGNSISPGEYHRSMGLPRLLILGTGFGSFSLLRRINLSAYDVTVVSPRNHFLFTPLLPSTTVGTIEFRTIVEPIRRCRSGVTFHLGRAIDLDLNARTVQCQSPFDETEWTESYDLLVICVGCVPNTFRVPGVEEHATFLKEVDDARRIRQKLVENLERASLPGVSDAEVARLLHFVAVGGGPTGVRFAGELYDLLRKDLPRSYPHLSSRVRVSIVDSGHSLLSSYDALLQEYVQSEFANRGIAMRTGCRVSRVTEQGLWLNEDEFLPCGMILWSAGFTHNPFINQLKLARDKSSRLITDGYLAIPGVPEIFALGDCACPEGQQLPQLAQVAEQQGRYLADSLNAKSRGATVQPFCWRPWGISSFIGGGAAVADFGERSAKFSGNWAYQQWRAAIWTQLVSVRSKLLVPLDRLRAFLFGRDISRL